MHLHRQDVPLYHNGFISALTPESWAMVFQESDFIITKKLGIVKDNEGKLKWLHVRLSNKEYEILHLKFKQSTCRKLSDYTRKMLLGKPITVFTRNQSLDEFVVELLKLKTELNALGNNYNQVVKRLHTTYDYGEVKLWLKMHESTHQFLLNKMEEIRLKMNQINDQWLQ